MAAPFEMKTIRIHIADYYGLRPENVWAYRILKRHFDVQLDAVHPEYVIDGGLGDDYLDFPDAVRLVIVGGSYVPNFNHFDYAVGFDNLSFGDRYLRLPLFAAYGTFRQLCEQARPTPDECAALARREFCSFVVSNEDGDPARLEFFRKLSKYKPVASGGKLFNNVGGRVADKLAFISRYKFNIAFENSVVPGYTTEKVMEALAARSVPIYYGNPRIEDDFNPLCMVRVATRDDMERAIEEIIRLDRDDEAYFEKLTAPTFRHPIEWYEAQFESFLLNIFNQPIESARRLNAYGYQWNIRHRALQARQFYMWTHPGKLIKRLRKTLGQRGGGGR